MCDPIGPADIEELMAPLYDEIGRLRALVADYKDRMDRRDKKMYRLEKQLRSELDNLRRSQQALKKRIKTDKFDSGNY